MAIASDRLVEVLAWLNRYADHPETVQRIGPPPLTVALSRQAGSGGADVAGAVGARLGWPVYDHELLDCIAQEKGLNARLLEHLDERHVGWLEESVRSLCKLNGAREGVYLKGLLQLLASLGKAGHCVIVGRGAAQVLPAETTLRVRVVAPRARHIAAVQKSKGLAPDQAEKWVDQHDRDRLRFVQHHFHSNAVDPLLYDMVLNTEFLNPEECANLIVQAARSREAHTPLAKTLAAV